jgi:hypothetical protein
VEEKVNGRLGEAASLIPSAVFCSPRAVNSGTDLARAG